MTETNVCRHCGETIPLHRNLKTIKLFYCKKCGYTSVYKPIKVKKLKQLKLI